MSQPLHRPIEEVGVAFLCGGVEANTGAFEDTPDDMKRLVGYRPGGGTRTKQNEKGEGSVIWDDSR